MTWVAAVCAALGALFLMPGPTRSCRAPGPSAAPRAACKGLWSRGVIAVGAGLAGWGFVGGALGPAVGVVGGLAAWVVLSRTEPGAVRREREAVARELPHLVDLLASTLRAGAEPLAGLDEVCRALPGPAAARLAPVVDQGRWGALSDEAWASVADDPVLAPLARAMVRSEASGASVVDVVERLADELEHEALASAEDVARRVGVAAAIPLGVCLLPAFLLLGVAPTVAALLASIAP